MRRAVALLLCAPLVAATRSSANFDGDWRFLLGDPRAPHSCAPGEFTPLNNTQCLGFSDIAAGSASAAACAAACCALGRGACGVWTFSPHAGCWVGNDCGAFLPNADWVGGDRSAAPPAPVTCSATDPCAEGYDDSAWRTLRVPHDYGVEAAFDEALPVNKGALPKNMSWYRKAFTLPSDADALVYLEFDGVFRAVDVFLNGAFVLHHEEGYTPFIVWLHNASTPVRRGGGVNTLAVFLDATAPELWSYEGMGITRHVTLNTAPLVSIVPWGFFTPSTLSGAIHGGADVPQLGDGATLSPQADVANAGTTLAEGTVTFALTDASGIVVCSVAAPYSLKPGGWARVTALLVCGSPASPLHLWNTAPGGAYLYTANATVNGGDGVAIDAVSSRIGIRSAIFTAADGFTLNGVKVVMRGFSNHVSFGGCGGAIPDRVYEFILTMLQSVGGNSYRTAHNPVARQLLDLADEYGVLLWSENRFIEPGVLPSPVRSGAATAAAALDAHATARSLRAPPPGVAVPQLLQDCQDMVLRDRNHPSIVLWSLCNELGCEANSPSGGLIGAQFKQAILYADQSRPITGNIVQRPYLGGRVVDEFAFQMEVAAFSHQTENVPAYRAMNPWKAVGLGESGSCTSDRGEYGNGANHVGFSADVIKCIATDMETLAIPYNFGAYSWTLQDYLGETSTPWPACSSAYGLFDLAGFPKDSAGMYSAAWRGAADNGCDGITIGNSDWSAPVPVGAPVDVAAYTCAPAAELLLNGVSLGVTPTIGGSAAVWEHIPFAAGNLTAFAIDASGARRGSATRVTAGPPASLRLWVESPYRAPRNGSVIAADGADTALLSVEVIDVAGVVCPRGSVNVTFSIDGPAAVYGLSNGDPTDHSPVKGVSWRLTYHGRARAIIASTGAVGIITVTASAGGGVLPAVVGLDAM